MNVRSPYRPLISAAFLAITYTVVLSFGASPAQVMGSPDASPGGSRLEGVVSTSLQRIVRSADARQIQEERWEYEPNNVVDQARRITVGDPQRHYFEQDGDVDWVKLRPWAGVEYTIRTFDLSDENNTKLWLYDAEPRLLKVNDDDPANPPASRIDWIAPADGTYFIQVAHPKLEGGPGEDFAYSLQVGKSEVLCSDDYESDDTIDYSKPIIVNGLRQRHTFHGPCGGDVDWVTFEAVTDTVYSIQTSKLSEGNDTILGLYDADGIAVTVNGHEAVNDDDPDNPPASRIDWVAPDGGTYLVKVVPFNPSAGGCELSYDLEVVEAETPPTPAPTPPPDGCADDFELDDVRGEARPIVVNSGSQDRTFHLAGDEDWIKFWAFAGNKYTIRTSDLSDGNDTVLCLYKWDGGQLACNDDIDYPGDLASEIVWTAPANGTYYAKVRHYNPWVEGCHDYSLEITSAVPCRDDYEEDDTFADAQPITAFESQLHNFHVPCILTGEHPPDEADWVWFWATGGLSYTIRTSNLRGGNDTVLCLYDASADEVACNDDNLDNDELLASKIEWRAPADGKYYVRVSPFDRRVGGCGVSYTLEVIPSVASMDLRPSPAMVSADGEEASTLTACIEDRHGDPVVGETVCFTTTLGKVLPPCAPTDGSGCATAYLTSTVPGTAIAGARIGPITATVPVTFTPPRLALEASPRTVPADGVGRSKLTATLRYESGTPAAAERVCFNTTLGRFVGDEQWMCKLTNGSGEASATVTSTVPGTAAVTATAGPYTQTARVTFTPPRLMLQAFPDAVLADGVARSALTATLQYDNESPVVSRAVCLTTTLGVFLGDGRSTCELTNDKGQACTALTSTMPGIATITATLGSIHTASADPIRDSVQITFEPLRVHLPLILRSYPPQADFTADQMSGQAPLEVCFTDESIGGNVITDWHWDLGDGESSDEQSPCHTYTESGSYDISLTISFPGGSDTETKAGYITIVPPCVAPPSETTCGWGESGWCAANPCESSGGEAAPGPLCPAESYAALICSNDPADVYYVDLDTQQVIQVDLIVPDAGVDYDLYLYHQAYTAGEQWVGRSIEPGSANEHIDYNGPPGRYYIEVWPYEGSSNTEPYVLSVTY